MVLLVQNLGDTCKLKYSSTHGEKQQTQNTPGSRWIWYFFSTHLKET